MGEALIPQLPAVTKKDIERITGREPSIYEAFSDVLESRGYTADRIVDLIERELHATNISPMSVKGEIIEIETPAWTTRQKARQDINRLRGDFPAKETEQRVIIELVEFPRTKK